MHENIQDALKAGRYETTPEGIFIPSENALCQGVFTVAKRGEPIEMSKNLVVNGGWTTSSKRRLARLPVSPTGTSHCLPAT